MFLFLASKGIQQSERISQCSTSCKCVRGLERFLQKYPSPIRGCSLLRIHGGWRGMKNNGDGCWGVGEGCWVGVRNYLKLSFWGFKFCTTILGVGGGYGGGWVKYFLLTIKIYFSAIFSLKSLLVDVTLSTFSQRKGILYNMSNPSLVYRRYPS